MKRTQVSGYLDESDVAVLDAKAKSFGMKRAEYIRRVLINDLVDGSTKTLQQQIDELAKRVVVLEGNVKAK